MLIVQALLFADGGLTALGTNITLMGLVGVESDGWSWRVLRLSPKRRPQRRLRPPSAPCLGARSPLSPLRGCLPLGEWPTFSFSCPADGDGGRGTALIGIGEAVITGLVVSGSSLPGRIWCTRPPILAASRLEIREGGVVA